MGGEKSGGSHPLSKVLSEGREEDHEGTNKDLSQNRENNKSSPIE